MPALEGFKDSLPLPLASPIHPSLVGVFLHLLAGLPASLPESTQLTVCKGTGRNQWGLLRPLSRLLARLHCWLGCSCSDVRVCPSCPYSIQQLLRGFSTACSILKNLSPYLVSLLLAFESPLSLRWSHLHTPVRRHSQSQDRSFCSSHSSSVLVWTVV